MTPILRAATLPEIGIMLDWAAAEGWNPGLDDAAAFYAADPKGFFIAEIAGTLAAAISVVMHSDSFAFLGFYICHPDWRGQGIGYALWRHALAHTGERTVGLDGVADQEANYARSGFVRCGASRRFEGSLAPAPAPSIRRVATGDQHRIAQLDTAAGGIARPAFLTAWTTETETRHTLVLDNGQGPAGFATIRRCREGVKIGPIIAPSAAEALTLACASLADLPAERAIIDLPSANAVLTGALEAKGFRETFATARMYRGTPPTTSASLQAIATMELG